MIQLMRSKAATWVARILAVLLIISFAVWGIEDMFRAPGTSDVVAEVGSTEIGRQEFRLQFTRVMNAMRQRLGPEFDLEQAAQLGLLDQTLDQMVNARLMTIEAQRLGLDAGEELIRQTIFNDERFHGADERFDRERYRLFLSREGMPEGAYVATLREQIIRNQVASALGAGASVPEPLLGAIYQYQFEQRIADVATVPLGEPEEIADPSDAALAEFHKNNPGLFTAPEYRQVTGVYLNPEEAAKGLRPSDERIREEFQHRKPTLAVPERRTIEQVLLQDEEKAKALSQQLKQGGSFSEVAQQVTGKPPLSLGSLTRDQLPDEDLAEAAFSLAKGAASEPIKSPLGWHILHVTAISPGVEPTLEQHRESIRADLAREMAIEDIIRLTEKLDDALASGAPIEEAAAAIGARALKIDAVDPSGLNPAGKKVENLPDAPGFLDRVFAVPAGETTPIEETRNGGYYALRVDKVTPPSLRPLDEVRARAVVEWKKSQVRDAAKEKAEKLQKAAKDASSLSHVAKESGYNVATTRPFTRFAQGEDRVVTPELAAALFDAKRGEPIVLPTPDGYAVAAVTKVLPAKPAANDEQARAVKQQLEQSLAGDAIAQFIDALRKRYPVDINRAAMESAAGLSRDG